MIEHTMAGDGKRMGLFVHHTDSVREYGLDRIGLGVLDRSLYEAVANGWHIVSMKDD
jgi:hypothetical protein